VQRTRIIGTCLILISAIGFGTAGTISKLALDEGLGTIAWLTWRALIGGALVAVGMVVMLGSGRARLPALRTVSRTDRIMLGAVAVGSMLVNLLMFMAFTRTTIALAMICFYTYPGLVTLGAVRFFGDTLDRTRLGALALGSLGLVLVLAPSLLQAGVTADPIGIAMACAASVLQAACVLGVARGFGPVPMVFTGTLMLVFGGVCYLSIAFLTGQLGALVPVSPGPSVGLYLALGIVVGAALPTLANLGGIRRVGPSQAAILMMLEVVVGTTMAILFLGERPSILQVIGGVAVLAAGMVLQLPRPGTRLVAQPVPPGA